MKGLRNYHQVHRLSRALLVTGAGEFVVGMAAYLLTDNALLCISVFVTAGALLLGSVGLVVYSQLRSAHEFIEGNKALDRGEDYDESWWVDR